MSLNGLEQANNIKCKANVIKTITRRICRNNCSSWDRVKQVCKFGYK